MPALETLFTNSQMQTIIWLIVIEVIIGIIGSMVKGTFNFHNLANFLHDCIVAYVVGFAVVEYIGAVIPSFGWLVPVTFIIIVLTLLSGIWNGLGRFGVPVPKLVAR